MRIVAIVGSIRRGNTYAMVEAACHAIQDCDIELIHLKDVNINMCDGCLTCDESGQCIFDDDMNKIIPHVEEANGLILGTPARWSLLSGELKVFLDRLNPLAVSEKLKGKKAIIFTVGQTKGEEAESIKLANDSVRFFCDNAGIEVVDTVIAEDCLKEYDLITNHSEAIDRCKKAAKLLYKSLIENE